MTKYLFWLFIVCLISGCSNSSLEETIWDFEPREGHSVEITSNKITKYYLVIRLDEKDYKSWLEKYSKGEDFEIYLKEGKKND